ncbi:transposase-like protein [Bradyrhizobium sp. USDA 3311]
MSELHRTRKRCPQCGKAMKLVPDETGRGGERYVCPACEEDPLYDPAAPKMGGRPAAPAG